MTRYKLILLILFLIALTWSAINPPGTYPNWLLENTPVFLSLVAISIISIYVKISDFSYTLILIYLLLPLTASHYGVAGVPFGKTLGYLIGTERNMFDRLTHFAFGLLIYYPIYEVVLFISKKISGWNHFIVLQTIMSLSAIYEIFEWLAAIMVNPVLADMFYASQGDIFDTPKDMAMAGVGALMTLLFILNWKKNELSN